MYKVVLPTSVGDDVPTVSAGGGGDGPKGLHELGVPIQAHWVGSATVLGVIVSIVFTFSVLKVRRVAEHGQGAVAVRLSR